jgi:peptidoglycan/LPS O-acetylase OafA/YrhL
MRRVPELDALRGIAAVVIMLFHLRFMGRFPWWGTAVDLFFVLSGYLITTIILDTRHTEHFFRVFYARRALRIWPAYYAAFLTAIVLNRLAPKPVSMDGWLSFLTYTQFVQGYWGGTLPNFSPFFRHSWTLAIEEQFYLLWPVLVARTGRKYLVALIIPLLIVPVVLRAQGYFPHMLLTRCDGLGFGALLAGILYEKPRLYVPKRALGWAFATVSLIACSFPLWREAIYGFIRAVSPSVHWSVVLPAMETQRTCLVYFGVVGFVLCAEGHTLLAPLRNVWLCRTGQISYGLYLYHPLVYGAVATLRLALGMRGSLAIDVFAFAACFVVASLSWRYIENPMLRLKAYFPYGERVQPTAERPAPAALVRYRLTRSRRQTRAGSAPRNGTENGGTGVLRTTSTRT